MDKLEKYRKIIRQVLTPYLNIYYANVKVRNRAAFDQETDQYLIISEGWNNQEHLHSCLIHLEIINNKIWIQCDNTEDGIANELVAAGIPKSDIVLAFHTPDIRKFTEFAIS
ncbi:XisI protein [Aphanothece sacrum]|uniref:XisI protein n=1 Tax=Aphanothece sacrum FPU1 TaxID=1920663 RepID=A0A401INK8_APHSA|nr:XisI protein [Aphanothece sacrum]GBF82829.1 XisI protein [Aphanothece sacrum FPU1]GBF85936.1 XisI protein [Aphanothece sacrum FPU3]